LNGVKCGGSMVGDGYTLSLHCEIADETTYDFNESDADPVYCDFPDTVSGLLVTNDYKDGKR
jgi:hypothetical protein